MKKSVSPEKAVNVDFERSVKNTSLISVKTHDDDFDLLEDEFLTTKMKQTNRNTKSDQNHIYHALNSAKD